jgi:heme-degrading monooxygenase HmoA
VTTTAPTGRITDDAPPGTVVFLIGTRINRLLRVRRWWPVLAAMPRMLAELDSRPELGLLSHQMFRSGRTVLVLQYWRSAEDLDRYARARDHAHLPAWREFNRRLRDNGDVGIFHETYVVDRHETVYVGMPATFGLAGATALAPLARRGQRAAHRLDPSVPDEPAVAPC